MVKRITSRQNPIVARFRAVARGEVSDLLLLDGVHLVREALAAGLTIRQAAVVWDLDRRAELQDLMAHLERRHVEVVAAGSSVMSALSPVRSSSPIVAIAERPSGEAGPIYRATPLAVVAVDVQDPGNLGAMIRVAEAAGATGLVTVGASADPFGWKALRGSMGSALRLPIVRYTTGAEAIDEARRHRCRLVATVPRGGRSPFDVDLRSPLAFLIGGEGQGLPSALIEGADERLTIPMQPPVESLNAAVTAAVVVYETRRQRQG